MDFKTLTIYGIFDKEDASVYIGQTTRTLKDRFRNHHFFEKKFYPETKGKQAYNIKVLKQILLFPQNKFKHEDFEGYFIEKYRNDGYNILNKKSVPFKNPFDIENMLPKIVPKRVQEPQKIDIVYGPDHVTRYQETRIHYLEDYIDSFDPENGYRCELLDEWLYYTYYKNGEEVPDNWFGIMVMYGCYVHPSKKYDKSIKM